MSQPDFVPPNPEVVNHDLIRDLALQTLDPAVVDKFRNLSLLYKAFPQKELLTALPYEISLSEDIDRSISHWSSEFTCLCPLNISQPDYASVDIVYKPDKFSLELKGLKFYLVSYRLVAMFHEKVAETILTDIVCTIQPKMVSVHMEFGTRGGVATSISLVYPEDKKHETRHSRSHF